MGGDDLGSDDDEYLAAYKSDDDDEEEEDGIAVEAGSLSSTRKRQLDINSDNDETTMQPPPLKKQTVLLESSRNLLEMNVQEQATFLSAALSHYSRLLLETPEQGRQVGQLASLSSAERLTKFLAQQPPQKDSRDGSSPSSFMDRLLQVCSKKRLKRHSSTQGSPCVLIVCQSARRAVAILKECAPLHLQALKLFPKQGSLPKQAAECRQSTAALAVGTPHRLLALLSSSSDQSSGPAMKLDATQLFVLDAATSNKNYTVCTLPDTAQDCMKLVQDHFLPELERRKGCKLVFC